MKEKKIFTVIYLLLLVSVVGNVIFFVNWLGSHSNQEKRNQEQTELVTTLEEENTQLKSRIDELLTSESESDSSSGEENAQATGSVEEGETTVGLPGSNEKQVAFLEEFARLQFGMGADQRAENLAQLGTLMSAEAFQEMNGSADVVPSAIGYTIEVEETEIYRQLDTENTNEYLIVVHQKTKTDQENATAVQSRLYYRVTLGNTAEGTLMVDEVSALMPYQ
jgi:cell division protein FtsB